MRLLTLGLHPRQQASTEPDRPPGGDFPDQAGTQVGGPADRPYPGLGPYCYRAMAQAFTAFCRKMWPMAVG